MKFNLREMDRTKTLAVGLVVIMALLVTGWGIVGTAQAGESLSGDYINKTSNLQTTYSSGDEIWNQTDGWEWGGGVAVAHGNVYYTIGGNSTLYSVNKSTGDINFKFEATTEGWESSSPIVYNETVYYTEQSGTLHAVDAFTGNEEWSAGSGYDGIWSPNEYQGDIYIAGRGTVKRFRENGSLVWSRSNLGHPMSSLAIANDIIVVQGGAGIYGISTHTGDVLWSNSFHDYAFRSGPTIAGGTAYFVNTDGLNSGQLEAYDLDTGSVEWSNRTFAGGNIGLSNGQSPITAANGLLYIVNSGTLLAVSQGGGTSPLVWSTGGFGSSSLGGATYANGNIYLQSDSGTFAFDADTGNSLWSTSAGDKFGSPIVADGVLYVTSGNAYAFQTGHNESSSGTRVDLGVEGNLGPSYYVETYTLSGQVYDEFNDPINDAEVQLWDGSSFRGVKTNSTGHYEITGIKDGTYDVEAWADGYELVEKENRTIDSDTTIDFLLESSENTVDGFVYDSNGDPVENASVTVKTDWQTIEGATTDDQGYYHITGVENGTYTLRASKTGYFDATVERNISGDISQDFTIEKPILSGWIDDDRGNDIDNATVVIATEFQTIKGTETNSSGYYETRIENGTYHLEITETGYEAYYGNVFSVDGNTTENATLTTLTNIVDGYVTDGLGNPLDNATVNLNDGFETIAEVETNATGYYDMQKIEDGTYTIEAYKSGYEYKRTAGFSVTTDTQYNFTLKESTNNITGQVVNESGDPIDNAEIELNTFSAILNSATTNSTGHYAMTGVPNGTFSIEANADRYLESASVEYIDQDIVQNFTLTPEGGGNILNGTVTGTDGTPIESANVTVANNISIVYWDQTDGSGFYQTEIENGTYDISAGKDGYATETKRKEILSDTVVDFALTEKEAGNHTLSGTLSDTQGDPIADGTVTVTANGTTITAVSTDNDGNYEVFGLNDGTYDITAKAGVGYNSTTKTRLIESDTVVNFTLTAITYNVSGYVKTENGSAISDATVEVLDDTGTVLNYADVDTNGFYTVDEIPPGNWTVRASSPYYNTSSIVREFDQNITQDFALATGTFTVSGYVRNASGDPIDGTIVELSSGLQTIAGDTTDTNGYYEITGVGAGDYALIFSASEYATYEQNISVDSDMIINATLYQPTLRIEASNYMKHGTEQTYTVIYDTGRESWDISNESGLTVSSSNTSVVEVFESNQTFVATSDESVNERVEISADYEGATDSMDVTVANASTDNIDVLPMLWRFNAVINDSTIFAIILGIFGAIIGTRWSSAFGGLGMGLFVLIIMWFAGYLGQGILLVAIFSAAFLGLNVAANIDYTVRR